MTERITEAELRRIYGETIDVLYGFALRRCGGQRELAEDVTQETWLRIEWRTELVCRTARTLHSSSCWSRSRAVTLSQRAIGAARP